MMDFAAQAFSTTQKNASIELWGYGIIYSMTHMPIVNNLYTSSKAKKSSLNKHIPIWLQQQLNLLNFVTAPLTPVN
jgi:hypothetical protein